jgi:hypothetical protein
MANPRSQIPNDPVRSITGGSFFVAQALAKVFESWQKQRGRPQALIGEPIPPLPAISGIGGEHWKGGLSYTASSSRTVG